MELLHFPLTNYSSVEAFLEKKLRSQSAQVETSLKLWRLAPGRKYPREVFVAVKEKNGLSNRNVTIVLSNNCLLDSRTIFHLL